MGKYIHYTISFAHLVLLSASGDEHIPCVIKVHCLLNSFLSIAIYQILQNACTISDTTFDRLKTNGAEK